ncbi:PIN domain-containing protein [bacterium]|nr:MAG: PIN domain-containing protein [bacterium]
MTKHKKRDGNRKKKGVEGRWYYDACVLRAGRKTIDEIRGKSRRKKILISYLTLGEAYGSCCNEDKAVEEAFRELFREIRELITIVNNDIPYKLFEGIREECKRIGVADTVHLATAIKNNCENLRTADRDIYGLTKETIQKLRNKFDVPKFTVTEMK